MSQVFLKRGSIYSQTEGNFSVMDTLDEGVYQIHQNPITMELFLERIADKFNFGFKLYGVDEKLVSHVLNTYNKQETKRNIGILLNGAKGTGKTVTAKLIANKLGLPVIICDRPYPGLELFLAGINHDCVFFFDEFEKNFRMECDGDENCTGESLLSIMDGVYNSDNCHIFILTTNTLRVNDNLLCRPSRIRYLKSFGDVIDRAILEEYVNDNVKKKEYIPEILEFIDTLEIATIDIVKSIVEEINLHDTHISEFKNFFNIKEAKYVYQIRNWNFNEQDDSEERVETKEEFLKNLGIPYNSDKSFLRPTYQSITTKKPFNKFKVGDMLTKEYRVIEIDIPKQYMKCEYTGRYGNYRHIYIENPEAKPSLYSNTNYTYGYGDDYYDF